MTDKTTAVAMIFSCIVLLTVSWLAMWTIHALRYANERVVHTQEVLVQVERLKFEIKDVESAGRGYLLSRNDQLKTAFDAGTRALEISFAELARLVSDNALQTERLREIKPLVTRRLELLNASVKNRDVQAFTGEQLERVLADGLNAMVPVMSGFESFAQQEKRLLQMRVDRADGRLVWVYLAISGGFVEAVKQVGASWTIHNEPLPAA